MKRLLEAAHFELWKFLHRSNSWSKSPELQTSLAFSALIFVELTYFLVPAELYFLWTGKIPLILANKKWIWLFAIVLAIANGVVSPRIFKPTEPELFETTVKPEIDAFRTVAKLIVILGPAAWFLLSLVIAGLSQPA